MALNQILDPILKPLLVDVGFFWTLIIVSVFVSFLTTLVYKFATDQDHLRSLKADLKRYQKKITNSKDNPEKALKIQKDVMRVNGEYMKHSMKSTLYTFLPIILFFGWLSANLAFAPLLPGELFDLTVNVQDGMSDQIQLLLPAGITTTSNLTQMSTNGSVSWVLSGQEGLYDVSVLANEEEQFFSFIISNDQEYIEPVSTFEESSYFSSVVVGNKKLLFFEGIPILGTIPWIKTFGWFGAYFLLSIVLTTGLRKAFKLA